MKVVYQICCGVEVHKKFLAAAIITTTKGVQPHYQKKRFSTFNADLNRFADWLKQARLQKQINQAIAFLKIQGVSVS